MQAAWCSRAGILAALGFDSAVFICRRIPASQDIPASWTAWVGSTTCLARPRCFNSSGQINPTTQQTTTPKESPHSTFSIFSPRLSQAMALQAGSLWQRHGTKVYTAAGLVSVWLVWRTACFAASPFIQDMHISTSLQLLAASSSIVGLAALYLQWYWGLNPATVYRHAMLQLNTSPAALEVLGAPLMGSHARAYIVTGGNVHLPRAPEYRPRISSRRLQMIFPLRGSEREGLVSLEVSKQQGRHVFSLLAVDVQPGLAGTPIGTISGARLYLQGDQARYEGSTALDKLREPFLQAVQLQPMLDHKEFENAAIAAMPRRTLKDRIDRIVDYITGKWEKPVPATTGKAEAPGASTQLDSASRAGDARPNAVAS